jgi:8-oxo-dGTP pyrophosphatase MutT (NUDIX family)
LRKTRVKLKELVPRANINWSNKQKLMAERMSIDYNENISTIWISKYNEIVDGNHRYTVLFQKFGGEHEINVVRFNISRTFYNRICLLLLPIILIIVWPIYALTQRKRIKRMSKVLAAGLFLVNKSNKLLICHPTRHPLNVWSIPKGKVEALETFVDACVRETYEETNIELSDYKDKLIKLDSVTYAHKRKELIPFVLFENDCEYLDLSLITIQCNSNVPEERGGFPEMDGYKWVTLEEAKELLHETQVACLDKVKQLFTR